MFLLNSRWKLPCASTAELESYPSSSVRGTFSCSTRRKRQERALQGHYKTAGVVGVIKHTDFGLWEKQICIGVYSVRLVSVRLVFINRVLFHPNATMLHYQCSGGIF